MKAQFKYSLSIAILILYCSTGITQDIPKGDILITNGTVLTITDGIKENTDILISDGKIAAIGSDLKVEDDINKISAEGKYVMPGIIDAHSHIAIDVINEYSKPITAEVRVGDRIDPYDISIYRALAGGVTTIHAMHGSANVIGGQCETLKLRYGLVDPDLLKMKGAPRTIKFALGENPMRVHGKGNDIIPKTRMGVEYVLRNAFAEAQVYKEERAEGIRAYDPKYETLVDILEGEIIIHCHSYRADEILALIDVLKDFDIDKIVFQHVNEGYKIAKELAEYGAMASVFSDWWAYKFEVYYSTAYNAAILNKYDVVTSINSDSPELIRHLYHEASKTQRYGNTTDNEALKMITLNPAKQLGIEDRVGSIEVGKDGDIAIFSAHPLSIYAIPQYTIVDGIVRFNRADDKKNQMLKISPFKKFNLLSENRDVNESCLEGVK